MTKHRLHTESLHAYHCKERPLSSHRYADLLAEARMIFRSLEKRTKRRPYVRSTFFHKDKIFFDYFWKHLQQKIPAERARRLRFLPCALELLRHSVQHPLTIKPESDSHVLLHRFAGQTRSGEYFYVQIKHDLRSGKKQLLSIFPARRE